MKGISKTYLGAIFFAIMLFVAIPIVKSQTPQFDLDLNPTSTDSAEWEEVAGNYAVGPTHIYGNFSLSLANDEFIDRVVFQVGSNTWNDSSDPFSWEFDTLDFTVGEHTIIVTVYSSENVTDSQEVTYYFEHEDKSNEQVPYPIVPIGIAVVGLVVLLVIVCIIKSN